MNTQQAIEHFGSVSKLAAALGIKSRQAIYAWGESPPYGRQCQLELITKGKLKANAELSGGVIRPLD